MVVNAVFSCEPTRLDPFKLACHRWVGPELESAVMQACDTGTPHAVFLTALNLMLCFAGLVWSMADVFPRHIEKTAKNMVASVAWVGAVYVEGVKRQKL